MFKQISKNKKDCSQIESKLDESLDYSELLRQIEELDEEINETKDALEHNETRIEEEKRLIEEKQNLDRYRNRFKKYYTFWNKISQREDLNYKLIEDMLNFDGYSMMNLMYQANMKYMTKTIHKQARLLSKSIPQDHERLQTKTDVQSAPRSKSSIQSKKGEMEEPKSRRGANNTKEEDNTKTGKIDSEAKSRDKSILSRLGRFFTSKENKSVSPIKDKSKEKITIDQQKKLLTTKKIEKEDTKVEKKETPKKFIVVKSSDMVHDDIINMYKKPSKKDTTKKRRDATPEKKLPNKTETTKKSPKEDNVKPKVIQKSVIATQKPKRIDETAKTKLGTNDDLVSIVKTCATYSAPKYPYDTQPTKVVVIACLTNFNNLQNKPMSALESKFGSPQRKEKFLDITPNVSQMVSRRPSLRNIQPKNSDRTISNREEKSTSDKDKEEFFDKKHFSLLDCKIGSDSNIVTPSLSQKTINTSKIPKEPQTPKTEITTKMDSSKTMVNSANISPNRNKNDLKINLKYLETETFLEEINLGESYYKDLRNSLQKMSPKKRNKKEDTLRVEHVEKRKSVLLKISGKEKQTETFDIPLNEKLYTRKLESILLSGNPLSDTNEQDIRSFFMKYYINDEQRRKLWKSRIGNKLKITKEIFSNLLVRLAVEGIPDSVDRVITCDMDRTFTYYKDKISDDKITYKNVTLLMKLFQQYRPDIGYTQGMIYIATVLYQYYSEYESFKLFCNLVLCNNFVFDLYKFDLEKIKVYNTIIWTVIQKKCPSLSKKLIALQVNTEAIVVDWQFTMYTRAFPIDIVRHIWDIIFCQGDAYIVKLSIALLMCQEKHVTSSSLDSINVFRKKSYDVSLKEILTNLNKLKQSQKEFNEIVLAVQSSYGYNK